VLVVVGFQTFLIALLGDLVAINRTMLEEMKLREESDAGTSSHRAEAPAPAETEAAPH
jgi:hypothetical protein